MPDPVSSSSDAELREHVQRVLSQHYEVDQEIGRGGMGIVYRAKDMRLKRQVAVKILPPELAFRSEIRSRFLREAETAAQLSHPNIVPIYSVDEREGLVYFIMGYIDGGNLAVRLNERGTLDGETTRRILREVADALAYAHARNVVHRDIKPDNILLRSDDGRAMVTDFGIARAVSEGADSRLTATGMAIGTPAYMSPEQAAGEREIDGRSDLYSLGVVGYQMLAGVPPFNANSTPALLVKHLSETPVPVRDRAPATPDDLGRGIMLLLEKDPANRFPSAAAFVTALDERAIPAGLGGAPTRPAAPVHAPASSAPMTAYGTPSYVPSTGPTPEEVLRWEHTPVQRFRRVVAPFLFVNAVILLFALLGGPNLLFVTVIWSVVMAYQYAKLWSDGYDWHDVFKQPRDRMMFDVAAETIDDARALFDPQKRDAVRQRERERRAQLDGVTGATGARTLSPLPAGRPGAPALPRHGGAGAPPSYAPPAGTPGGAGRAGRPPRPGAGRPAPVSNPGGLVAISPDYLDAVRQAHDHRGEIARQLGSLGKEDRERLGDIMRTADQLAAEVQGLAISLTTREREQVPGAAEAVETEITRLEAEANPLDERGSDERVRRLAHLKRQRRAIHDVGQRVQRDRGRLEACVLGLQNLRYDLLNLKSGQMAPQQVTQLVERVMSLSSDVDGLVLAEEIARGGSTRDAARRSGV